MRVALAATTEEEEEVESGCCRRCSVVVVNGVRRCIDGIGAGAATALAAAAGLLQAWSLLDAAPRRARARRARSILRKRVSKKRFFY